MERFCSLIFAELRFMTMDGFWFYIDLPDLKGFQFQHYTIFTFTGLITDTNENT